MSWKARPYQVRLIDSVIGAMPKHKEVLLAACPNAGKTSMAIEIIRRLVVTNPSWRFLVLAHATKVLRAQFLEQLEKLRPAAYALMSEFGWKTVVWGMARDDRRVLAYPTRELCNADAESRSASPIRIVSEKREETDNEVTYRKFTEGWPEYSWDAYTEHRDAVRDCVHPSTDTLEALAEVKKKAPNAYAL